MTTKSKKEAVSKEVALGEVRSFLSNYNRRSQFTDEDIEEDYPDVLEAVQLGLLIINDSKVTEYKLETPIKNEDGEIAVEKITFKTRIKPTTKANLASGIDLRKDAAKYSLNIIAHIIDQPKPMLDKFEPFDYNVIQQVSSVFS